MACRQVAVRKSENNEEKEAQDDGWVPKKQASWWMGCNVKIGPVDEKGRLRWTDLLTAA